MLCLPFKKYLFTTLPKTTGFLGCYVYVCVLNHFSRVRLFETLWTVAHQAPLSMGFSSKNTPVGCQARLQGIFQAQGSNLRLLCFPLACGFFTTSAPWEAQ